jgi:hypothetical protein
MKTSKKTIAILISCFLLLLCFVLNETYRPYIYQHKINDFHFADTFTSWFCIPCATLLFWGFTKNVKFLKILLPVLIGFIVYEFIGFTFDWYDIITLFTSAGITCFIYLVYKKHKQGH